MGGQGGDGDKPLHGDPYGGIHRDGEEDLGDGQQDGDEVGVGEEQVGGGDHGEAEGQVGQQDGGGVGDEEQRQQGPEYRLQLQVLLLQHHQGQEVPWTHQHTLIYAVPCKCKIKTAVLQYQVCWNVEC